MRRCWDRNLRDSREVRFVFERGLKRFGSDIISVDDSKRVQRGERQKAIPENFRTAVWYLRYQPPTKGERGNLG